MFTVYALYSTNYSKIYIGYTSNLEQRLRSHNELSSKGWTVKFRPWKLVYIEQFHSKKEAMKREIQLKSASGRKYIWSILKNE